MEWHLEELGIGVYRPYSQVVDLEDLRVDFSSAAFPSLKILHVHGLPVPWTRTVISRLTYLEITRCIPGGPSIGPATFFDVLRECTQLEELRICDEYLSDTLEPANEAPTSFVALPQLRKLVLADRCDVLRLILSHIRLPVHVDITITTLVTYLSPRESLSFCAQLPLGVGPHRHIFLCRICTTMR